MSATAISTQKVVLGEVIDIRDGTHDTPAYVESGIPLITSKNLSDAGLTFDSASFISEEDHAQISKRSGVQKGDVLYGMIGTIGKPTLVEVDRTFSIKNIALFKQAVGVVDSKYLRWLLDSPDVNAQIARVSKGGTQKFVALGALRGLTVHLPPLEEQRHIAAILDQAETLRTQRRAALAHLDSLTQSLFLDMFGDGNTPEPTIGELLEKKVLLLHKDGNHGSLYPRAEEFGDEGVPFLSARCVSDGGEIQEQFIDRLRDQKANQLRIGWIEKGDVLLAHNASVGKVALYDGRYPKALIGTSLTAFRADQSILSPEFLAAAFRSTKFQAQLFKNMGQTTRNQVPITAQRELRVALPPLALQQTFATRIQTIEALKATHRAALAQLDALFASLQQRAFAGDL